MKSIGHPLFNDPEYGGDRILKGQSTTNYKRFVENAFALIPGQALHARSIGFIHPTTKKEISFEINIPEGFEKIIEKFEKIPT